MLKWFKERWREMRGNAMWDVTKFIAIPLIYALFQAIRQQPLHWVTLSLCLIFGAVIVLATRSRSSLPVTSEPKTSSKTWHGLTGGITATIKILPRTARYDNMLEAVKACEIAVQGNPTDTEIQRLEKRLSDAVQHCAQLDEWHRFKSPTSGDSLGQLREKITITREVMERLRKRGY
jgi:hypothetical protein